jgi:hypothetical protein
MGKNFLVRNYMLASPYPQYYKDVDFSASKTQVNTQRIEI